MKLPARHTLLWAIGLDFGLKTHRFWAVITPVWTYIQDGICFVTSNRTSLSNRPKK